MDHALNFVADSFDQDNTFAFAYKGYNGTQRTSTAYLFNSKKENKIYIMQKSGCIKAEYTAKDHQETARLNAQVPVRSGDTVTVEGKEYSVVIVGNYSDAGFLVAK